MNIMKWDDERKPKLELLEKTAEKSVWKGPKFLKHLRNHLKVMTEYASLNEVPRRLAEIMVKLFLCQIETK